MSWLRDLWQLLQTVATLTKEVEHSQSEIDELRQDLNTLTFSVTELKGKLKNTQETTALGLEHFESEIGHAKESIAAKFDVLTARLDLKIADLEGRLPIDPGPKRPRSLKSGSDI